MWMSFSQRLKTLPRCDLVRSLDRFRASKSNRELGQASVGDPNELFCRHRSRHITDITSRRSRLILFFYFKDGRSPPTRSLKRVQSGRDITSRRLDSVDLSWTVRSCSDVASSTVLGGASCLDVVDLLPKKYRRDLCTEERLGVVFVDDAKLAVSRHCTGGAWRRRTMMQRLRTTTIMNGTTQ